MNATQLLNSIRLSFRCADKGVYFPIIAEGIHGIGKSQIFAQVAAESGYYIRNGRFIDLRLSIISDVGELVGNPVADQATGTTKYFRPSWFPVEEPEIQAILDKQDLSDIEKHKQATAMVHTLRAQGRLVGGLIFYDEVNRAKDDIRNASFQAILDRKIFVHDIPYGWVQAAAINPANDDNYEVFELDTAYLSRFCKVRYELEDEEWLGYAKGKIWEPLRQFLNKSRQYIGCKPLDTKKREIDQVAPCPRSWFKVSDVIGVITEDFTKIDIPAIKKFSDTFAGFVGDEVIPAFNTYLDKSTAIPLDGKTIAMHIKRQDINEIVKSWLESKSDGGEMIHMSVITATLQNCLDHIQNEPIKKENLRTSMKNIMTFCMMVPKDAAASFFHKFTMSLAANDEKFVNDKTEIRNLLVPIDDELKLEFGQSMYENVFARHSK